MTAGKNNKSEEFALGEDSLSIEKLASLVFNTIPVSLSPRGIKNIEHSHNNVLDVLDSGKVVYGLNTGYGALSSIRVSNKKLRDLQVNLIRSHCCGSGEPFSQDATKAVLIVLANALTQGHSGCRKIVVETLVNMINKGVFPVIPMQGSLGASGDLIPLAHLASVLIGEGEAIYKDTRYTGKTALKKAGIAPVILENREGISLINGTHVMTGLGSLAVHRARTVNKLADIASAISLEVLLGTHAASRTEIHDVRPHPGQIATASNIRKLVSGSEIMKSHKFCDRVQDAYSLRCVPQVHGAVKDALRYCQSTCEIELNSVTDNPIVFDDMVLSGGNFHGQPLAISLDTLGIAMTDLGNISERRIDRLMNPHLSDLPAFLTPDPGLNSGFMMSHYLAASLSFENRGLATPGSIDSVPVSSNKEDFNSNGLWCARKAWQIIQNTERIIAVELLCAVQALDFRRAYTPGLGSRAVYDVIRKKVPVLKRDRVLQKDVFRVLEIIRDGELLDAVEENAGELDV